jgi:hypothetical protein
MLTFPVERGNILNLVAFASDRSKHEDERVWDGAWVKPVSMEQMLADFKDWDERPRRLLQVCSIVGVETRCLNLYTPAREGAASVGLARVPPAKLLDPRPDHAPRRCGKSQPLSALHVGLPQTRRPTLACRTTVPAPAKQLKMRTCSASCSACPSARARRYRSFCLRTRPCAGPAHQSNRFIAAKPARYAMSACVPRNPSDGHHCQMYEFASPLGDDWEQLAKDMPHRYDWLWTHDLSQDVMKAKEQLRAQGLPVTI